MNRFAFLDDIEDTLWDAAQQTIDEALAAGQHPEHRATDDTCAWCGHAWHGTACSPTRYTELEDHTILATWGDCGCINADTPLDDTWRHPTPTGVDQLMADQGLDGYAAIAFLKSMCRCLICTVDRARARARRATRPQYVTDAAEPLIPAGILFFGGGTIPTPADPVSARPLPITGIRLTSGPRRSDHQHHIHIPLGDRPVWPDPQPSVTDPRARALAARQQRNTGPERPAAGRQRRPRRLGSAS